MKNKTMVQYTIRQVPVDIDNALRKRIVKERKSLNAVVLDVLRTGSGVSEDVVRFHDLDALAGTWVADRAFDQAIEAFEVIEKDLWK